MKKKYFDRGLMVEGLSQLRLPGILFLIVAVFGSAVPAILRWLNYAGSLSYGTYSVGYPPVGVSSVAEILVPIVFAAPFVFCLVLFGFLNNRRGSDFYHSLPSTRPCLYISFTISIAVWLAVIVASSVLVGGLITVISGVGLNGSYIPFLICSFFCASLLVTGCMLLAMSLTGTVFTNIILFGLVLFLPRFIIYVGISAISRSMPVVGSSFGGLANPDSNIPVALVLAKRMNVLSTDATAIYCSVKSIIYTLVLGLIYLAAAGALFYFRKSETAGTGAPNRVLQHVFRCVVTLPVALLIPFTLASYNTSDSSANRQSNVLAVAVLAVISVLIYFVYELLTTKSLRRMFRSAPLLFAVAAVCVVFGVSLRTAEKSVLDFAPTSSEIKSVSILSNADSISSNGVTYNELSVRKLSFSGDAIKSVVSRTLSENLAALRSHKSLYSGSGVRYDVGIRLDSGKYVERIISVTPDDSSKIADYLESDADYLKYSTELPAESEITRIANSNTSFKPDDIKKLWSTYTEEYKSLPEEDRRSLSDMLTSSSMNAYSGNSIYTGNNLGSFNVEGYSGVNTYTSTYPFMLPILPKTSEEYVNLANAKEKAPSEKLLASLAGGQNAVVNYFDVTVYNDPQLSSENGVNPNFGVSIADASFNASDSSKTAYVTAVKTLLSQIDEPVDLSRPFAAVSVSSSNSYYMYYEPLSHDNSEAIAALNLNNMK